MGMNRGSMVALSGVFFGAWLACSLRHDSLVVTVVYGVLYVGLGLFLNWIMP